VRTRDVQTVNPILKQIGLAVVQYTQDYDERMPLATVASGGDVVELLKLRKYRDQTGIWQ